MANALIIMSVADPGDPWILIAVIGGGFILASVGAICFPVVIVLLFPFG